MADQCNVTATYLKLCIGLFQFGSIMEVVFRIRQSEIIVKGGFIAEEKIDQWTFCLYAIITVACLPIMAMCGCWLYY